MNFPTEFFSVLWVITGFFLLKCSAFDEHIYPKNATLKCWDCNSEYDYRCGDPFNNYSIGIMNCNEIRVEEHISELFGGGPVQPRVCRKIVQRIENRTRIIRGCGFLPDKYDDKKCISRSGTKNVNVQYCACTTSLCNAGHREARPSIVNFFISLLLTIPLCSIVF